GDWSIFYDAPRPDIACPRYYGAAARQVRRAHVALTWTAPMALRVGMDAPELAWTFSMATTPLLGLVDAVSPRLPLPPRRPRALLRVREWIARRLLRMGELSLSGIMPSGHYGILMPARIFFITEARAVLDGLDLGAPASVAENPRIGGVSLPARPTFAIGQA